MLATRNLRCAVALFLTMACAACSRQSGERTTTPANPETAEMGGPPLRLREAASGYRQRWAVVVGVNKYPARSGLRALNCAATDAHALAQMLREDFGYSDDRGGVLLLADEDTGTAASPTRQ